MRRDWTCSTHFWLRKLHSLTGFLFLGYFLCRHLGTGASYGTTTLRLVCLFAPLLFHALYGLYVTYESLPNALRYPWVRNSGSMMFFERAARWLTSRKNISQAMTMRNMADQPILRRACA